MTNCSKCKLTKSDGLVGCEGPCNGWFHYSCVNLSKGEFDFLQRNKNVLFICNSCLNNVDINERNTLGNFNSILSNLNDKIEHMGESMEYKLHSKISELSSMIDDFKSSVMSFIKGELTEVLMDNTKDVILPKIDELKPKLDQVIGGSRPGKATYCEMVKLNSVLLKPKNSNQRNATTKSDLYQNINPLKENIGVSKVTNISNGGVVVSCKSEEESNKFKLLATTKLADKYEVKEAGKLHPRIKIVGLTEKHEEDTIVNLLVSQNKHVFQSNQNISVINIKPLKKSKSIYQILLQLNEISYKSALEAGNLAIGYDFCTVYDAIEVRRCFKCCGFNHTSKNCKNKLICPICSGEHGIQNCASSEKKCINCINVSFVKPGHDANHSAWDRECPIYREKVALLKRDMLGGQ